MNTWNKCVFAFIFSSFNFKGSLCNSLSFNKKMYLWRAFCDDVSCTPRILFPVCAELKRLAHFPVVAPWEAHKQS